MLASELREMTIEQLQSLTHSTVVEMLRRVEEAEESKAEVHKAYDELAEVAEVYESQAKVLRESCEKAAGKLSALVGLPSMAANLGHLDVERRVLKELCDGLFLAIERADKLGNMEG